MKSARRHNTQLFALPGPPPELISVRGGQYRLHSVFKHDFLAATTLYELVHGDDSSIDRPAKLVVKFCRQQGFCGIDCNFMGLLLFRKEQSIHRVADPLGGIQCWYGTVDGIAWAFALEYVPGQTIDKLPEPPDQRFFDKLRELIDRLHAAGLAYGDLNKRGNIIMTPSGEPVLIDFQLSIYLSNRARWLKKAIALPFVRAVQRADIYHLYKHKRRMAPDLLREDEEHLSRRISWPVRLHRMLYNPIKSLRRTFLIKRRDAGLLVSPTESLEAEPHGETTCWRSV